MSDLDAWKQLQQEATQGQLILNPDGLADATKQVQDYLDRLDEVSQLAGSATQVSGFGSFPMGRTLASKLGGKAGDMMSLLKELNDQATVMKDVFAQSIKNYQDTEAGNVRGIAQAGGGQHG